MSAMRLAAIAGKKKKGRRRRLARPPPNILASNRLAATYAFLTQNVSPGQIRQI